MEETRVSKYQKYREGIANEDPKEYIPFDNQKDDKKDILGTTSTLPINEILKEVDKDNEHNKFLAKQNKKRIIKYVLIGLIALAVIAGLVVFGIYAWR